MATCCKHCMTVLEIPFCQFFTDFLKEPAVTKHEFSKITLGLQLFGSVFRYKSHLFMYPKIFYIWLTYKDTTHSQKCSWFELNSPILVHIYWWVSFTKSTPALKCLFRLSEERSTVWIFILYPGRLHKYHSNYSKTVHVNEVATQAPNCFCYYTYSMTMWFKFLSVVLNKERCVASLSAHTKKNKSISVNFRNFTDENQWSLQTKMHKTQGLIDTKSYSTFPKSSNVKKLKI